MTRRAKGDLPEPRFHAKSGLVEGVGFDRNGESSLIFGRATG